MRRERELLINDRDALLPRIERIARAIRLAIEPHLAFVRLMGARKHFHERALASPVFADEIAENLQPGAQSKLNDSTS